MKHLMCLLVLSALPPSLSAAPQFPFPQSVSYPYGIVPSNIDNGKVQRAFEDFVNRFYEESPDKTTARIKHDTEANTVSEGIGYGMLVMVYMDNAANNTRDKFDKLWAYYNKFLDAKGLMNWKISGFSGVAPDGKNAATDAELDAAVGLMEAYKQWGDEKYFNDAKALIEKIAKNEVDSTNFLLNPGDSWGGQYNPSYFSTAALELFKKAGDYDWDKIIDHSYALIKTARNATTGLMPDWCTKEGTIPSMREDKYSYDATRTPWRMAWAYVWYGHEDAKDICSTIASWISSKTGNDASKVVDGYKRDGTALGGYNNATFVGPFACAGMVDAQHRTWLDNAHARLEELVDADDVYYQQSLKLLTLLLLGGNMPDLWNATGVEPRKNPAKTSVNISSRAITSARSPELTFSTDAAGDVTVSLYTLSGRLAAIPVCCRLPAGNHSARLDPRLPAGCYIAKMRTSHRITVDRVTITR